MNTKFINNYTYPSYDDYTCLCIWEEKGSDGAELNRINRYCRIHGSVPKISNG